MSRYKNGNPKHSSRFICIKHLGENYAGVGMQRSYQRRKWHIKDLYCPYCKEDTKNMEVRWCDTYEEVYEKSTKMRGKFYQNGNN